MTYHGTGIISTNQAVMSPTKLPKWATFTRKKQTNTSKEPQDIFPTPICPKNDKNQTLPQQQQQEYLDKFQLIQQEDFYLRQSAYSHVSTIIDHALRHSIREKALGNEYIISPLLAFFNKFQPSSSINSLQQKEKIEEEQQQRQQLNQEGKEYIDNNEQNKQNNQEPLLKKARCDALDNDVMDGKDNNNPNTTTADNTSSSFTIQQIVSNYLQSEVKYPPTILPLAIIDSPPSILDRKIILEELKLSLSRHSTHHPNVSTKSSSAICTLHHDLLSFHSTGSSSSYNYHNDLIFQILSQCIEQESNPNQYQYVLTSSYRHRNNNNNKNAKTTFFSSWMDRLLHYVQRTASFHSIIVIHENSELLSIEQLQHFIHFASSLRSNYGIPISLILPSANHYNASIHQLSLCSSYAIGGDHSNGCGVSIQHFTLGVAELNNDSYKQGAGGSIITNCILDYFLDYLYSTNTSNTLTQKIIHDGDDIMDMSNESLLMIVLSGNLLKKLRHDFDYNHKSVVKVSLDIKKILAHYFSISGSFISLLCDKSFVRIHKQRLAWFFVDSDARSFILSSAKNSNSDKNDNNCDIDLETTSSSLHQSTIETLLGYSSESLLKAISGIYEDRIFLNLIPKLLSAMEENDQDKNKAANITDRKQDPMNETSFNSNNDDDNYIRENVQGDICTGPMIESKIYNFIESFLTQSTEYKEKVQSVFTFVKRESIAQVLKFFHEWIIITKFHIKQYEQIISFSVSDFVNELSIDSDHNTKTEHSLGGQKSSKDSIMVTTKNFLSFLYESVILLDALGANENAQDEDDPMLRCLGNNIDYRLRESIVEKLDNIFFHSTMNWSQIPLHYYVLIGNKTLNYVNNDLLSSLEQSMQVAPRRTVSTAILSLTDTSCYEIKNESDSCDDDINRGIRDVGLAFQLFETRIISTRDWFFSFAQHAMTKLKSSLSECDRETSFRNFKSQLIHRFSFAVYQLILCGLVTRCKRREDAFERVAMVWGSG